MGRAKQFDIVVAATATTFGIGRQGALPWRLRTDMAFFKRVTSMPSPVPGCLNAVIMGRKTYESIPVKFRPLQGRINVVISRNVDIREELSLPAEVLVARSLDEALALTDAPNIAQVFVVGGGSIYAEAARSAACGSIIMTTVRFIYSLDLL